MKKNNLKIILFVIALFIVSFANFSYADIVATSTDIITSTSTATSTDVSATSTDIETSTSTDIDTATDTIISIDTSTSTSSSTDLIIIATSTATSTDIDTASSTSTSTDETAAASSETFIIRNGENVIFQNSVSLPPSGTSSILDVSGHAHDIDSRSVLAILNSIGKSSGLFSISDLEYYDSYGAFYLKCITPTSTSSLCDNWQFAVGNSTPYTSIEQTILSGGETIGIYFGTPHKVIFNSTAINSGGVLTAASEKYNYSDNTWSPLTGVIIGVTQPNPDDVWNPIVIATSTVDSNGTANFTFTNTGTYNIGIADDYYFPSYSITVNTVSTGGSGGGGGSFYTPLTFNTSSAINYLKSVQSSDGSFGNSDMYTDWAAIAYGAYGVNDNSRDLLLSYLNSHSSLSSTATDNERRAMALLALGQNPYSFAGVNYIDAILKSFDGAQFSDPSLVNDDIFALIPLSASGYSANDEIISKDIQFIISKQNSDGSWGGSIDMTSAGIMALLQFNSVSGVSDAITKAKTYLQNSQNSDGGWGNISSSSWAIQAMKALSENWTKNGKSTDDYLIAQQISDGAVLPNTENLQNRIWATSYAIPAALGKSWSSILHVVSKPTPPQVFSSGGGSIVSNLGNTEKQNLQLDKKTNEEKINSDDSKKEESAKQEQVSNKNDVKLETLPIQEKQNEVVVQKKALREKKKNNNLKNNFVLRIAKSFTSFVKENLVNNTANSETINLKNNEVLSANALGGIESGIASEGQKKNDTLNKVKVWSLLLEKLFVF